MNGLIQHHSNAEALSHIFCFVFQAVRARSIRCELTSLLSHFGVASLGNGDIQTMFFEVMKLHGISCWLTIAALFYSATVEMPYSFMAFHHPDQV